MTYLTPRHPVLPEIMEVFTVRFTMYVRMHGCALGVAVTIISTMADISISRMLYSLPRVSEPVSSVKEDTVDTYCNRYPSNAGTYFAVPARCQSSVSELMLKQVHRLE